MKPQLFYHLVDPAAARVRKHIMERDILKQFQFRNLSYPEVQADLARLQDPPPDLALWDGTTLHVGEAAVMTAISRLG